MLNLEKLLNIDWNYLYDNFDWFSDMRGVEQDYIHHAEGDVETHVKLVYQHMINYINENNLPPEHSQRLLLSVLFHDVEKRKTTVKDENGRISAPGHARKGEYTTREFLYTNTELDFLEINYISHLVKWHGVPLWHGNDIVKKIIEISQHIKLRDLYVLAYCDVLGRICEDQDELLLQLEIFKEECIKYDCWEKPYNFNSSQHKIEYLQKEKPLEYIPYLSENKPVCTIVCGLPGVGKDYYIKNNIKTEEIISLDSIRQELGLKKYTDSKIKGQAIQEAKKRAKIILASKNNFVWNATNITKNMRRDILSLCDTYGYDTKIIYLYTDYKNLLKQNKNRKNIIPENVINKLIRILEPPLEIECNELIYIKVNSKS